MNRMIPLVTCALALPPLCSCMAGTKSNFVELKDEPSRKELFQLVKKAYAQEHPESLVMNPKGLRALPMNRPFMFPTDAELDRTVSPPKKRENAIFGIDISHYEGASFPFDTLIEKNVRFVYVKATQGAHYIDKMFPKYWATLASLSREKSVLRGAYHFLSAGIDGAAQADHFLNWVELNGGFKESDMPAVLDLEWDIPGGGDPSKDRWKGHNPDEIMSNAVAWLKKVEEKTKRAPIVYTCKAFWGDRKIPESSIEKFVPRYKIWIANYSKSAKATEVPDKINKVPETLWQFSETARLAGFKSDLDANVFYGTQDAFKSELGLPKSELTLSP